MSISRDGAFTVLLCTGLATHAGAEQPIVLPDPRSVFDLDLPDGCSLASQRGPDFDVFYVSCNGQTYAGIYVGNAANSSMTRSRLIKTSYEFPSQIQVWSNEIPSDQQTADKIAASVRLHPKSQ